MSGTSRAVLIVCWLLVLACPSLVSAQPRAPPRSRRTSSSCIRTTWATAKSPSTAATAAYLRRGSTRSPAKAFA